MLARWVITVSVKQKLLVSKMLSLTKLQLDKLQVETATNYLLKEYIIEV